MDTKKMDYTILKDEIAIPYELAMGPTWTRFFEGFKQERIYATRCPKCKRVLVPARSYCPRCFVETDEWLEVSQEGTIVCWALTEYEYFAIPIKPPYIGALIKLDGTDTNFLHLVGGIDLSDPEYVRKTIKNGMKVRVVWNTEKKGTIMDIKYFEPMK